MYVDSVESEAVIDDDGVAIIPQKASEHYSARIHCLDRCTDLGAEVGALVANIRQAGNARVAISIGHNNRWIDRQTEIAFPKFLIGRRHGTYEPALFHKSIYKCPFGFRCVTAEFIRDS